MIRTVVLLLITLIVVPVIVLKFDVQPTEVQWGLIKLLVTIYVCIAGGCFLLSTAVKNYGQVDKLWSILPFVYAWVVAFKMDFEPRVTLMACLATLWGARLTFNFMRRGGYSWKFWTGEEDYRWEVLRQKPFLQKPWGWMLFNLFFISFYQLGLILLFTLPIVKAVQGVPLGIWDFVLAGFFVLFVVIETIADQQQWNYMEEKKSRLKGAGPIGEKFAKGFTHTGLWAYSRHPNYAAEQSIWLVFYLFTIASGANWINWSIGGWLLLVILFKSSSDFSEEISSSKYPDYKNYQKNVGRFLPKVFKIG